MLSIDEMTSIMLDFKKGLNIYSRIAGSDEPWQLNKEPGWNWDCYEYKSEDPLEGINEDHEIDFDDGNSAYYMGGRASYEDYMDAQECEAYDPYAEDYVDYD